MRGLAVLFIALQKGQSNRRSHLPGYAVWEIHPGMKTDKDPLSHDGHGQSLPFCCRFPPISRQPHQKRDVEEIILTNGPFL